MPKAVLVFVLIAGFVACGVEGPPGPPGPAGPSGNAGAAGTDGTNGEAGANASSSSSSGGSSGSTSSSGGTGSGPTSGTRIKARTTTTLLGADGTKQESTGFGGWFDAQRNEPCTVSLAADGKMRCLPAAAARYVDNYFADAACTQSIVLVTPVTCAAYGAPLGVPKYLSEPGAPVNGCTGMRYRPMGAKIAGASYYLKSGANCFGPYPLTNQDAYDASGAEIPPTEFVAFTSTSVTTP